MIPRIKTLTKPLLMLLIFTSVAHSGPNLKDELQTVLSDLNSKHDLSNYLAESRLGSLESEVEAINSRDAAKALVTLWLAGYEDSLIELEWWKSKVPLIRSLTAALLFTGRPENTSNVPFLDPSRYSGKERVEREQELVMVEENSKAFGLALKRLIMETYDANPNKYKAALVLRFSRF